MIKIIRHQEAKKIWDTLNPKGLFLIIENDNTFTAIDNTTCDAWTENFRDLGKCLQYLHGCDLEELEE